MHTHTYIHIHIQYTIYIYTHICPPDSKVWGSLLEGMKRMRRVARGFEPALLDVLDGPDGWHAVTVWHAALSWGPVAGWVAYWGEACGCG